MSVQPAPRPRAGDLVEQRVDAAVSLALDGFLILEMFERHKNPIGERWQELGMSDPETIARVLHRERRQYGVFPPAGSRLLVIDFDVPAIFEQLSPLIPPTLVVKTAKGWHVYGRLPDGVEEADVPRTFEGGEIRIGGSGQVVGPFGMHPSGAVYTPENGTLKPVILPVELLDALKVSHAAKTGAQRAARGPDDAGWAVTEPGRHDFLLARGRNLRGLGLSGARLREELQRLNVERCSPPKDRAEVDALADWIEQRIGDDPPHPRIVATPTALPGPAGQEVVEPAPTWPTPPAAAAYHGVLGALVRALEDEVEPDPAGILGGLLAAFGALAGNGRVLYQAGAQAPSLFVVLVGDSAVSRKGTSYGMVRTIFELAGYSLNPVLVPGLGSGEGLVGHLQRRVADESDNRALVVESEFGRLLRIINREGSTLSPILREAWDGVPLGRVLARDSKVVPDHHVCLYANTNRRELRQQLTETNGADGLGNRFLWLAVRRTKLVPLPPRPDPLVAPHIADLAVALDFARRTGTVSMGVDAADHWTAWYSTRAPRLGLLGVLTARAEAQVARLAMVYALADRSETIGLEHLEAAIAFWEYAERSAGFIFGESTGNRHADVLLGWLQRGDEYGWKEAKLALGMRTAADLQEVVDLLTAVDLAEVVERPHPRGGRSVRIIRAKGAKGAKGAEPAHGNEG